MKMNVPVMQLHYWK